MCPAFHIRPAVAADFEPLCSLYEELDEHHRLARPDLFRPVTGERRERSFVTSLIEGPESTILVAQNEAGQLLGFVSAHIRTMPASPVRDERRFTEIDNLVVASAARRGGIGRALMAAAEAWSAEHLIEALELNVYSFNDAVAFYEACGFDSVMTRMRRPIGLPP